jgi:DNA-binding FrmR family transcriptional regulator/copper chaperone CopZ
MTLRLLAKKHAALDDVNAALAQLEEVTRMLESDTYCVDVMRQVQTVQCLLERVYRATMSKHLQTCFVEAVLYGREEAAIDELLDAAAFIPSASAHVATPAIGSGAASNARRLLAVTTFSVPGIASPRCQAAIEGIVTAIAGVGAVEVDLPRKTLTVHHDSRATRRSLIQAIEEQGYHIADALMAAGPRTGHWRETDRQRGLVSGAPALTPHEYVSSRAHPGFLDGDGI